MEIVETKSPEEFATEIMGEYHFATYRDSEEMLVYKDGVYLPHAESLIKEIIEEKYNQCNTHYCSEVIGHIQRRTYKFRYEFDSEPFIINVKNGLLDVRAGIVTEHRPDYYSRIQIPVEYNESAKCPNFLKFLESVQPDPQNRRILLEFFAYCLWRTTALQKALMNVGFGSNGKSTFESVIERLLGKNNVSNQSLQKLASNRFASARLDGKLANIHSDISDKELLHTGIIKMVITGNPDDVEHKNKDFFKLESFAKLIFSANKLPEIFDDSDAFFRRWLIINWDQKFVGDNCDPQILDKISTPEELSGIFNILIGILRELIKRQKFSYSPSTEQIKQEWTEKSDTIGSFLDKFVIQNSVGFIPKAELYEKYVRYCSDKGYTARVITSFNEKLRSKLPAIDTSKKVNGKNTKIWLGINWKETVTKVTKVTTLYAQNNMDNNLNKGAI